MQQTQLHLLHMRLHLQEPGTFSADQTTSQVDICFFCRSDYATRRHLLLLQIRLRHKKTSAVLLHLRLRHKKISTLSADQTTSQEYICCFCISDYVTRIYQLCLQIRLHHVFNTRNTSEQQKYTTNIKTTPELTDTSSASDTQQNPEDTSQTSQTHQNHTYTSQTSEPHQNHT